MAEIKADKEAKLKQEQDAARREIEIRVLRQQVEQLQEANKTGALATDMMQQFVSSGVVEHNGADDFIVHSSQGEMAFSSKKKQ